MNFLDFTSNLAKASTKDDETDVEDAMESERELFPFTRRSLASAESFLHDRREWILDHPVI